MFALTLTAHAAATFGPRVKTIKISWPDMLEAEYMLNAIQNRPSGQDGMEIDRLGSRISDGTIFGTPSRPGTAKQVHPPMSCNDSAAGKHWRWWSGMRTSRRMACKSQPTGWIINFKATFWLRQKRRGTDFDSQLLRKDGRA